jgi:hypothetical protein
MGNVSPLQIIEWDETIPVCTPACTLQFQIQLASDSGGAPGTWTSTWSGPDGDDGDATDYFTVSSGELIPLVFNDKQWVRYRIELAGDGDDTPVLLESRLNYR